MIIITGNKTSQNILIPYHHKIAEQNGRGDSENETIKHSFEKH